MRRKCMPCIVTHISCSGCTIVGGRMSVYGKGAFLDLDNCHVSGSFLGGACVQLPGGSGSLRHCTLQGVQRRSPPMLGLCCWVTDPTGRLNCTYAMHARALCTQPIISACSTKSFLFKFFNLYIWSRICNGHTIVLERLRLAVC
jgi:hypothetical protein